MAATSGKSGAWAMDRGVGIKVDPARSIGAPPAAAAVRDPVSAGVGGTEARASGRRAARAPGRKHRDHRPASETSPSRRRQYSRGLENQSAAPPEGSTLAHGGPDAVNYAEALLPWLTFFSRGSGKFELRPQDQQFRLTSGEKPGVLPGLRRTNRRKLRRFSRLTPVSQ